jgi:autotransporter-associated beta strand protein
LNDAIWRLDTNGIQAYFGYNNQGTSVTDVPYGSANFFTPAPTFRGQPTTFSPGLVPVAFSFTFQAATFVVWTLGSTQLRVDASSVTNAITSTSVTRSTTSLYPKLTVSNSTTLTLAGGTHTATNGVFLGDGGILRLESGVLDTAAIAMAGAGAGTLQFAHAGTAGNPFRFTRDGTASGPAVAVTGAIQLIQTSGHTVLQGPLAHTGGTVIEGGTLELGAGGNTLPPAGAVTLTGGTLQLGAADQTVASLAGPGGTVQLANGRTLTVNDPSDATFAGVIAGGGAFAKTGAGTLTLSSANTYSGGTTLSGGTVRIGHASALGTGTLTLNGSSLGLTGGALILANNLVLQGDTTFTGAAALTLTGNLALARTRELTISATAPVTLSGVISGAGRSLNKFGAGELVLTAANTYTGGTFIDAGIVRINNAAGSAFGTGAVTIGAAGTLTGAGSFTGALQNNGTYAPGNSPTLAVLSAFAQGPTGVLDMEIAGLDRGTGYDALDIAGAASLDGTLAVTFYGGFTAASLAAGDSFDFFNWGSVSGTFAALDLPALGAGLAWDTSALYTTGALSVSAAAIPEPSTWTVLTGAAAPGARLRGLHRLRPAAYGAIGCRLLGWGGPGKSGPLP